MILATLRSVQALLRSAERLPDDTSGWLEPVRVAHRAQISRLVDVAAELGIDVPSAAGSTSPVPTPTGTSSQSSTARTTSSTPPATSTSHPSSKPTADLAKAETRYPAKASERDVWGSSAANLPMLVALCASRRAAGSLLGGSAHPTRGTPPAGISAVPIARAIRPAVYGFEQIAGKTPVREREQVAATLRWLSGARTDLGPVVSEPERLSYDLPLRVTDAASARRLARLLLRDVLAAVAAQAVRVGAQGSGPQDWVLRIWASAAADEARWGAAFAPFPGLRT